MRVVRAHKESARILAGCDRFARVGKNPQHYWHGQQELLCRGVLVAVVDLLPHVQLVVCTRVEFKGDSLDPVEHDVRALFIGRHVRRAPTTSRTGCVDGTHEHIGDVGQCPAGLLRDAGNRVVKDLEAGNENNVHRPSA